MSALGRKQTLAERPQWWSADIGRCLGLSQPMGIPARGHPYKPEIRRIDSALSRLAERDHAEVFAMKTTSPGFALNAAITGGALLITACAASQSKQPSPAAQGTAASSAVPGTSQQLPAVSADRCVAESVGTATDPSTGAPMSAAIDPQTGKPLMPSRTAKYDATALMAALVESRHFRCAGH